MDGVTPASSLLSKMGC